MKDTLRLLRLLTPFAGWMALAVVLGAATVGSSIALLATSAYLISAAALHPSIAELSVAVVGVRFFGLTRGVLRYLERYVAHATTFRVLARLRVWFYQGLEPLAPARLLDYKSGDLLARAVADIDTLQDFFVRVVAPPGVALLVVVAMALFIGQFAPLLALIVVLGLVAVGVALPVLMQRLSQRPGAAVVAQRAALYGEVVDGVQGLADIVAFGRETHVATRIQALAAAYAASQKRLAWLHAGQAGAGNLLMHLSLWAVLVGGITLVSAGRISGVYLATLALATLAAFEAVLPLPQAAQALTSALAAARRIFALVDTPPAVNPPALPHRIRASAMASPDGIGLTVRDLHFAYQPGEPAALNGISFDLLPGQRVAIVGPSGAGKSTLVNLLLRFWDYTHGEIYLDGLDLRQVAPDAVRRLISVIPQQAYLFNATLRDNILVARPDASEAEVVRAAQRAHLHDFILSLPHGYATWIGERGVRLSGGERQRLAIARALLRETPVLILDEPTANLDAVTERGLLQTLDSVMRDRSVLLITHRLVGLDRMDEILVLQAGRIVERGRHADLLQRSGLYAHMWRLQHQAQLHPTR